MRSNNFRRLFLSTSFFLLIGLNAGLAQDAVKLSDYLKSLEQQYDIRFSYASDAISDISITPTTTANLAANLEYIKARTGLQIKQINARYYSISAPDSM